MQTCEVRVGELLKQFKDRQNREVEFGARDTEPDWVWQDYIARALGMRKGAARLPDDAEQWELYSEMPGAEEAALRLTQALRELTQGLKQLVAEDPPAVIDALRGKLWRLDL